MRRLGVGVAVGRWWVQGGRVPVPLPFREELPACGQCVKAVRGFGETHLTSVLYFIVCAAVHLQCIIMTTAGLGRRARKRYLKQQQQPSSGTDPAGAADGGAAAAATATAGNPAAAAAAGSSSATGAGSSSTPADRWLDSGHMWHGERVVRLAMARGGEEELLGLIKR